MLLLYKRKIDDFDIGLYFSGGVCVNTEGSYTCRCPSGLTQAVSQTGTTSCVDERVEPCYMEYRLGWWIFHF